MKTKLTLTVRSSIIAKARRQSKKTGKSISQMFEELFENDGGSRIQSEPQRAAIRLLKRLEAGRSVRTKDDKQLLRDHVARKFA